MRFGLIGFGAWGRLHAQAIRKAPGAILAAIACGSAAGAEAATRVYPQVAIHRDWRSLLVEGTIDAVDIVVPNHLHAEMAIAALEAGKCVLLEKPMAISIAECDRVVETVERTGGVLSVGHEFRLSTQWGAIKQLIEDRQIGHPLYAMVSLFRFPYRRGSGDWRYDQSRVGSWILEEPVHFFDMVMWWLEGCGNPASVQAFGNAKAARTGMNDNFSAVLRWENGAYAVITQTLAGFEHHHVVEVVGTEGAVRGWWSGAMDRTQTPKHGLSVQRRGRSACEMIEHAASGEVFELEQQLAAIVAAFDEGRSLVSAREARKRIVVCLEAERSLHEVRAIALQF